MATKEKDQRIKDLENALRVIGDVAIAKLPPGQRLHQIAGITRMYAPPPVVPAPEAKS